MKHCCYCHQPLISDIHIKNLKLWIVVTPHSVELLCGAYFSLLLLMHCLLFLLFTKCTCFAKRTVLYFSMIHYSKLCLGISLPRQPVPWGRLRRAPSPPPLGPLTLSTLLHPQPPRAVPQVLNSFQVLRNFPFKIVCTLQPFATNTVCCSSKLFKLNTSFTIIHANIFQCT